jgi:hypothetical protein
MRDRTITTSGAIAVVDEAAGDRFFDFPELLSRDGHPFL